MPIFYSSLQNILWHRLLTFIIIMSSAVLYTDNIPVPLSSNDWGVGVGVPLSPLYIHIRLRVESTVCSS